MPDPTILYADEDPALGQMVCQALEREGYRVHVVRDAHEALRVYAESAPGLVIADLELPKTNGSDLLECIRNEETGPGRTPVVLLSATRISRAQRDRAKELRAQALLLKPVRLDRLKEVVAKHLKPAAPEVEPKARRAAPVSGRLADMPFPQLLHQLHGLRATGVLRIAHGNKRKSLQLRDGYPIAVKSNLVNECLGNLLVDRGVMSEREMNESIRRVKSGEGLQGEILVAMEVLHEEELTEALREQADAKLFDLFGWREGRYRFDVGRKLERANSLAIEGSPASLILDGVSRQFPLARIDAFLAEHRNCHVIRSESPFYAFQDVHLDAEASDLVGKLDGSLRLDDFRDATESLRRSLYALVTTQLLELKDAPAKKKAPMAEKSRPVRTRRRQAVDPERDRELRVALAARAETLRSQSYFEMFEVSQTAGDDEIQAGYNQLAHQLHPDRFREASRAVQELAEEVLAHMNRGLETLLDTRQRLEYQNELRKGKRAREKKSEGKRALDAETAFQRGEAFVRQRSYEAALRAYGEAIERNPEEGEYHAHYGWCLHLCHPEDASIMGEAIEHVRRGVKLARDREKPYLFLGRLYKAEGRAAQAEKMFALAVQIRPDCVEAMRELRLINLRRQKSKGLFGRMLRR